MSAFASNLLKLLRGTVVAQIIALLALPFLSRAFGPEAFGSLQTLQSLLAIALVGATLRLEVAILSSPNDELPHLLALCGLLCVATSAAALVATMCWTTFGAAQDGGLGNLVYFLPVGVLIAGFAQVLNYLLLRNKEFNLSAASKVAQSGSYVATAAALSASMPFAAGLAFSDLAGRVALLLVGAQRRVRRHFAVLIPTREKLAAIWRRHHHLVQLSLPGAVINAIGAAYTPLMMFFVFGAYQAGQYALVERLIGTPIAMIAGAASQVFMSSFADAHQPNGKLNQHLMFRRLVKVSLLTGAVPAVLLLALSPSVFPWLLGAEWQTAGLFAQAMTPLMLLSFVAMPVNMALVLGNQQRLQFAWDLGRLLLMSGTWAVLYWTDASVMVAVWTYTAAASLSYLIFLFLADGALARMARPSTPVPARCDVGA